MENQKAKTKYYVGDLCYVIHDAWDEVCDRIFPLGAEKDQWGKHTLSDGRVIRLHGTAYGDGEYQDQHGNRYGVDAGLIGCIAVSDIGPDGQDNISLGAIHEFVPELLTSNYHDGVINFHDTYTLVSINTDEDEEEDYFEDDYEGEDPYAGL